MLWNLDLALLAGVILLGRAPFPSLTLLETKFLDECDDDKILEAVFSAPRVVFIPDKGIHSSLTHNTH